MDEDRVRAALEDSSTPPHPFGRSKGAEMHRFAWPGLVLAAAVASCGPTISTFSPIAYEQATSRSKSMRGLMDRATEPYADHRADTES